MCKDVGQALFWRIIPQLLQVRVDAALKRAKINFLVEPFHEVSRLEMHVSPIRKLLLDGVVYHLKLLSIFPFVWMLSRSTRQFL